jgi:hypothetical protein
MTFDIQAHVFRLPEQLQILRLALDFFEQTPVYALPPPAFRGTGVYALYYQGDFEPYARLAMRNRRGMLHPIYVGKAVARGWRTGRTVDEHGGELARRMREHARSIQQTTSLKVTDFHCRFMVMVGEEASLIASVEAALTRTYSPLWNAIIDGFGNHDPGSGRYDQAVSEWDALHPGRGWVTKLMGLRPAETMLIEKVRQHLAQLDALPADIQSAAEDPHDPALPE